MEKPETNLWRQGRGGVHRRRRLLLYIQTVSKKSWIINEMSHVHNITLIIYCSPCWHHPEVMQLEMCRVCRKSPEKAMLQGPRTCVAWQDMMDLASVFPSAHQ